METIKVIKFRSWIFIQIYFSNVLICFSNTKVRHTMIIEATMIKIGTSRQASRRKRGTRTAGKLSERLSERLRLFWLLPPRVCVTSTRLDVVTDFLVSTGLDSGLDKSDWKLKHASIKLFVRIVLGQNLVYTQTLYMGYLKSLSCDMN